MDLTRVTARELMSAPVVTVKPELTVADLMDVLLTEGLSGVPVVDRNQKVVGVVSSTDIVRAAVEETRPQTEPPAGEDGPAAFYRELGAAPRALALTLPANLPRTHLGALPVRDIMTRATLSVRPEATLPEIARFFERSGVHRVLVLEGSSLVGILSALDLIRPLGAL
ncbi:MAG: CBS domain-containing protein [Candidatus Palauibacterales bacterium]|nr:CBS domain-containing protein [Candidatus Palauibacterales bacterium]MDP2528720.1 CBS domain-containing protein [Candidatus Palauibacterales bacterium]MDP2585234.1 CBS domain-containing protein [Candidatus Palauibacterales bacterium]